MTKIIHNADLSKIIRKSLHESLENVKFQKPNQCRLFIPWFYENENYYVDDALSVNVTYDYSPQDHSMVNIYQINVSKHQYNVIDNNGNNITPLPQNIIDELQDNINNNFTDAKEK